MGPNTALLDDPELTTRLWPGNSPVRLVIDLNLRLQVSLKLFNGAVKTIVFNTIKKEEKQNLIYYKLEDGKKLLPQLLTALYELNIQSVLVEGGATLLQSFIAEGNWDEARIITNEIVFITNGLDAPVLTNAHMTEEQQLLSDKIEIYKPGKLPAAD